MKHKAHALPHEKPIFDYQSVIEKLKEDHARGLWNEQEIAVLEEKLERLKQHTYAQLDPWQRVQISRHTQRPRALQVIAGICQEFEEIFGDRLYRDDPALVCGFCKIGQSRFICLAQEKGTDLDSRMARNFGMMHPEGYRKALRVMKLAEKFGLPVLTLIDTPGAYAGLEAEQRGQGWAIAENLKVMSRLKTPIISVILSEGASGGALGIGLSDVIGMLEHAYYSVITPEGCASILWKDTAKREQASAALKLNSENLLELALIDEVIPEPLGGAHHDIAQVYRDIQEFTCRWLPHLQNISTSVLLQNRYGKFRAMGRFEEAPVAIKTFGVS